MLDSAYQEAYSQWAAAKRERSQTLPDDYADGLEEFLTASIRQFLSGADHKNIAYSPLNVYMALAMLAETTDGESRQQILDLLGSDSIGALREQASAIWNTTYCNDGARTSILANSLWLNEEIHFNQTTMDTLADTYYASSYQGEMGSDEFNAALQAWLNEQTGGLFSDQISNINMTEDIILALASTIYFRDKWRAEFSEGRTEEGVFHTVSGDVTCEFMHQSSERNYYWGELFTAVYQAFAGGGMWLVLPDEGVTTDDLLASDEAMQFLLSGGRWEKRSAPIVNLSLPKFDVSSQIDLCEGLQALGVTDIFDYTISDFTPMTTDTPEVFVSQATHGVRVQIDEEGCTAAAYTIIMAPDAGDPLRPEEEVDFILDRPFIFAIAGTDGLPLFAGIVNQPG